MVYVEVADGPAGTYQLRQVPEVEGALVVMDPHTGRVLAMVGGFSYAESQFNRATQALRQPGSSFKPLVYAAALDNGYTPSSVVMDAPIQIDLGPGMGSWQPENYGNDFLGPSTLRTGIELSRNVMTVRLAQDMGMPLVAEYARRFGIYDNMQPVLSMALGAGETSVLRMVAAYAVLDNGGRAIKPTLIDRIQDRFGRTIFRHEDRVCEGCDATKWEGQDEPTIIDNREQVLDPMTAYQITSMLQGVIERGTGSAVKVLGKPVAGKTGTTNDYKDAWFIGYTPRPRRRPLCRLRQAEVAGQGADRRRARRADLRRVHADGGGRQACGALPRAAGHELLPDRPQDGPERAGGRAGGHPRGLQAGHGAAGYLFDHRLYRSVRPAADGGAGIGPGGGVGDRRALLAPALAIALRLRLFASGEIRYRRHPTLKMAPVARASAREIVRDCSSHCSGYPLRCCRLRR